MHKEVLQWLHGQSVYIAESYLRLRVESHPDYPSLLAIQDTLEELGINAYACSGTKEELRAEAKPFLAHFSAGGGYLVYAANVADAEKKVKDFDKHWSGHVLFMDKPAAYGNTEHDKRFKQERLNRYFALFAIMLVLASIIGLAIYQGNTPVLLLAITNTIGLCFAGLIAQKEFGISNSVTEKICSMAKHSRCEAVILSKGAKLFNWLTWGDVGIIYFSTSLLFLLYSLLTWQPVSLYYLISLAGLIFPFYSVYYQWRVVKQWCMLCLGVLAVLMMGGIVSLFYWDLNTAFSPSATALFPFSGIGMFMLAIWQLAKSAIQKLQRTVLYQIQAIRTKRNPQILNALLENEKIQIEDLPEAGEAVVFGNSNAPYKMVIACNPYCGPCAKAHKAVEELIEKYPHSLQVAIRFAIDSTDESDPKVSMVKDIIKAAKQQPYKAVRDWYHLFDREKFLQMHPVNGEDVSTELEKQVIWTKQAGISATPTFFIGGRKLPAMVSWADYLAALEYELKNTA
jgi:uncharacterized membrane protein/thiol-disulfide isomerase/thioredoxin